MTDIRNHRDLVVWQKAMELVEEVYLATSAFPREEIYGLTSQLRRSAVSIPSDITEGQSRMTSGQFVQLRGVARGSLAEAETQILLAQRLGYLRPEPAQALLELGSDIGRLQNGLLRSLTTDH